MARGNNQSQSQSVRSEIQSGNKRVGVPTNASAEQLKNWNEDSFSSSKDGIPRVGKVVSFDNMYDRGFEDDDILRSASTYDVRYDFKKEDVKNNKLDYMKIEMIQTARFEGGSNYDSQGREYGREGSNVDMGRPDYDFIKGVVGRIENKYGIEVVWLPKWWKTREEIEPLD